MTSKTLGPSSPLPSVTLGTHSASSDAFSKQIRIAIERLKTRIAHWLGLPRILPDYWHL